MTDEQLVQLSRELDNSLATLLAKYQITPLSLAAVVLARLVHLADHSDNIYNLMRAVGTGDYSKPQEKTLQ